MLVCTTQSRPRELVSAARMVLLLLGLISSNGASGAVFTTLDLVHYYNSTTSGYLNGGTFPIGEQVFGGVPFQMPAGNRPQDLYAWNAHRQPGENPRILEITVNHAAVDRVYMIMNTFWGSEDPGIVGVEFVGTDGAFQTFDVVGNDHIRDFNNWIYTNKINGVTTIEAFNNGLGQRLDRVTFDLSDDFLDEALSLIRVIDNGGFEYSRVFVVAATVEAGGIDCDAIRTLKVSCRRGALAAKVRSTLQSGTLLTLDNDGDRKVVTINARGKAKAKWTNQSGIHTVSVVECPDLSRQADCG